MTTIIATAPMNMKKLRSAIDADEPKVALSWVVSAVRRETSSPVFSTSKKLEVEAGQMGEDVAAQVGHDPLAERHDQVVAGARRDRQHGDDADQADEIEMDEAGMGVGKAVVDHLPHGDRHDQRRGRGDDQRGERADHPAAVGEGVGQQRLQRAQARRGTAWPSRRQGMVIGPRASGMVGAIA